MFTMSSKIFVAQPYWVGGVRKSLAIVLPAKLTKACNISPSTAFEFRISDSKKSIILHILTATNNDQKDVTVSAGEKFQVFNQQTRTKPQ